MKLASERMVERTGEVFDEVGQQAIEQAKEKGIEFYELSEEELDEWKEYINPTIDNWIKNVEDRGLPGQEVYDRAVELIGN